MAKLMSKQTRETVITSTVLVVALALIFFYIIYPLIYVDDMVTREVNSSASIDTDNQNPITFDSLGLIPDTINFTTDDNIELSTLYFSVDTTNPARGTAIIIPDIFTPKENYAVFIDEFVNLGLNTVIYDQRGAGQSTGDYHTPGIYEAENLNQLIIYLKLHDKLATPVIAHGYLTGADAAIYASQTEDYVDYIIASKPYLTPNRWISSLKELTGKLPIPFSKSVYFWWYSKKSGYGIERTGVDEIKPIEVPTLLISYTDDFETDEYKKFIELSGNYITTATNDDPSFDIIRKFVLENISDSLLTE